MACIVRIIVPGYPLHITQPSQISIAFVRRWILGEEFGSKKTFLHIPCSVQYYTRHNTRRSKQDGENDVSYRG